MFFVMEKNYTNFKRDIDFYCDTHLGEEVLFTAFVDLWNGNGYISKKDLVVITSKNILELLKEDVLTEVEQTNGFQSGYGLYKILPHENLIKHDFITDRKMKLLK